MTGQAFIVLLALVAVLAVLLWTVADHFHSLPEESTGPALFDRDGRLIGATAELPVLKPGRHRARWSR